MSEVPVCADTAPASKVRGTGVVKIFIAFVNLNLETEFAGKTDVIGQP